jgi:DNA-binding transcriptional LysR family regulator
MHNRSRWRAAAAFSSVWQIGLRQHEAAHLRALQAAALQGLGIGFGPWWQVRESVARGALELLLQDFEGEPLPLQAVLPPTRTQPAKVRLFVDMLAARIGNALQ